MHPIEQSPWVPDERVPGRPTSRSGEPEHRDAGLEQA
jgi:hypothetical protein